MPFLPTILTLILVFVLLLIVNRFLNGNSRLVGILNIVVVVAVIIWLLRGFGVLDGLNMA